MSEDLSEEKRLKDNIKDAILAYMVHDGSAEPNEQIEACVIGLRMSSMMDTNERYVSMSIAGTVDSAASLGRNIANTYEEVMRP